MLEQEKGGRGQPGHARKQGCSPVRWSCGFDSRWTLWVAVPNSRSFQTVSAPLSEEISALAYLRQT
jgi:hypothetical protein